MIKSVFSFLILFPFFSFSAVGSTVEVFGKIINYDEKTVTISQEDQAGRKNVTVPKDSIPKHFKMKTGQCVYSILDRKEFMQNMSALYERTKTRQSNKMKKLQENMNN